MSPRRSTRRRLRSAAGTVAAFACVAAAAAMLLPMAFGYERYVITGSSMEPTIHKGSLLYAKSAPVEDLHVGDIITYVPPAGAQPKPYPVTHRIHWKGLDKDGKASFRTKGDNNTAADPWTFVLDGHQQARYTVAVPYVGYAFAALSLRLVRMLLIGLPALLVGVSVVLRIWRDAGEEVRRREHDAADADELPTLADTATAGARA